MIDKWKQRVTKNALTDAEVKQTGFISPSERSYQRY